MAWARRRRPEAEKSADPAKARATGLEYLAAREHSAAELYDRLCRRYTEAAAAQAIADLVEQGWLDDTRYALMRAQSLLYARKSRRAAAHVLRGKGLTNQQVQQALEEVYAAPEEGEEKLKRETEEFFSALPAACAHAADIANCLKEHPELMREPDCLYKAFARYAAGALRTPEQLMADGQFLKDHVLTSTAVKAAVIGEYLGELRKGAPPAVLGSGGLSCVLPPRTPASIEEAGRLFLKQNS